MDDLMDFYSNIIRAASFRPRSLQSPNAWVGHMHFAAWLVKQVSPEIFVELGTHTGNSYFSFCQSVLDENLNTKCFAVDTWLGDDHAGHYGEDVFREVDRINRENYSSFSRLLRMRFDDAVHYFSDGSIGILHIDGLHSYEAVRNDFELWLPKVKDGGIILFHDINVRERDFGVWRLWDELKERYPRNIEFLHSNGLGVLQVSIDDPRISDFFTQIYPFKRLFIDYFSSLGFYNLEYYALHVDFESIKEDLNAHVNGLEIQISNYEREIDDYKIHSGELQGKLLGLSEYYQSLVRSRSWKLTAPLRFLFNRLRGLSNLFSFIVFKYREGGGGFCGVVSIISKILHSFRRKGFINSINKASLYGSKGVVAPFHNISPPYLPAKALETRQSIQKHVAQVDIVICVHNALGDVSRCLESVIEFTSAPFKIIIVDDGSAVETKEYLDAFVLNHKGIDVSLLRNEHAKGYTFAANQGMRTANSDYVVLLNSDTIVSPEWLDRMIACATSNHKIGIVGPLSNTASWQSIPEVESNGDWADNLLPEGISIKRMAELVASNSVNLRPLMSFLNGFCLLIKRDLINEVGFFDEVNFAEGYGEENDFCLRARGLGWLLAVADDVYVYHAQSKSYSHERRKNLSDRASEKLSMLYSDQLISEGVMQCQFDRVLAGIRARSSVLFELDNAGCLFLKNGWGDKKIAFILPVDSLGGGANVIFTEAVVLASLGVNVSVINLQKNKSSFESVYHDDRLNFIYIDSPSDLSVICCQFDALIATHNQSVYWVDSFVAPGENDIVLAYYVQDYEPYFYADSIAAEAAKRTYGLVKNMIYLTKTDWNQREVYDKTGIACNVVGPCVDLDLFRPRPRLQGEFPARPIRICAMVRPSSPRRAAYLTMDVLAECSRRFGNKVEIYVFGVQADDHDFLSLPHDFPYIHLGVQTSESLALFFNEVDIFVDFSEYQAMGLTAMEAMACGVACIVPECGGAVSYAKHNENSLVIDTHNRSSCVKSLSLLVLNEGLRLSIQRAAIRDMCRFSPIKSATAIMSSLFGSVV